MGKTLHTLRAATLVAATALALASAPPASLADYQFIVSGYPAANVSYPSASTGTDIVTATCSSPTTAVPLEARYRTWGESEGIDLRSDASTGFILVVR